VSARPRPRQQGYEEQGTNRRGTRGIRGTGTVGQSPVQVDILADPNGIKARIKTLGLQKALEEVAGKSQSEMRQWQQKRYDNRTLLIRTVQKQFENEIGFIRKVAVEEKAKKTTEAIDSMLSGRQERLKKVSKELLAQKRELRQTQPARGRGRARTSGRGTGARGRYTQRGQQYGGDTTESLYGRGSVIPGTNRPQRRPSEEVDIETENEINQWLQANVEDKTNLAEAVHEQIWVEISSIRSVAVKEEAKKTTATIDGLLLYRQTRFEELFRKMEEQRQALQQTQDPRIRGRGRYLQDGQMQQQNQPRTRIRQR
jgi:N-acetylglutamate synthase-like GNAT family acetyltransferase